MGSVIAFGIFTQKAEAGCAGDCMTCHEVLENSEDHNSLKACIKCHEPSKNISVVGTTTEGCGDNCFECHNQWPKDGYHADLDKCKNCHQYEQKTIKVLP